MRVQHTDAQVVAEGGQQIWAVDGVRTADDGTVMRFRHFFPLETLEWRAAEYGIEPTDTATLLDIVLAEPYLSEEDWSRGHQLHDAPDIDTARADHLARCARAKLRHRISTRGAAHPCRRVAVESPLHPEAIELKQQFVAQARAAHTHARDAAPPDRIAVLRTAVTGHGRGVGE
ncbi:hypothetical protein [Amycolatopsis plumensis]|uniref:Uncharacterized protein n=1 Tax=Amycolatopsis plumensis TaxID=236508 RepID=A0ABV5UBE6_9PSEU